MTEEKGIKYNHIRYVVNKVLVQKMSNNFICNKYQILTNNDKFIIAKV